MATKKPFKNPPPPQKINKFLDSLNFFSLELNPFLVFFLFSTPTPNFFLDLLTKKVFWTPPLPRLSFLTPTHFLKPPPPYICCLYVYPHRSRELVSLSCKIFTKFEPPPKKRRKKETKKAKKIGEKERKNSELVI